jgi:hypothetical protein
MQAKKSVSWTTMVVDTHIHARTKQGENASFAHRSYRFWGHGFPDIWNVRLAMLSATPDKIRVSNPLASSHCDIFIYSIE